VIFLAVGEDAEIRGALGGAFFPDLNNGTLKGSELVWYVVPKFRGRRLGWALYNRFYREAVQRGAAVLTMAHLIDNDSSEVLKNFYLGEGYRPVEIVYAKEIQNG
jgi:GNAT superfamily N-acetyltransferase